MKYKKYNLIFFAIAALLWAPVVYAAPTDLIVDFQNTPLFNEVNFLPESEVMRWAKVKNNTLGTQQIIVETINESDPNGLAGVFEIGIYKNGIKLYGTTTLANFFGAGEVFLSDLAGSGAQTQYDFLVRFVPSANNPYQASSLGFDILIGFKGDEGSGGSDDEGTFTTAPPNGGGPSPGPGSPSGGGILSGLVIQNEASVGVTDTTATIEWNTSFKSTSRVVYGTAPGVFDFSLPPNYGYPFSTLEFDTPANPNGVTLHIVIVTGLTPSTPYYFRVISHASPDTISKEISFTTLQNPLPGGSSLPPSNSNANISAHSENALLSQAPASDNGTGQTQNGTTNPVAEKPPPNTNLLVAALFGLGNINTWWLLLILILLIIIYWIYRRQTSD